MLRWGSQLWRWLKGDTAMSKKKTYDRWRDLQAKKHTPDEIRRIDREVARELVAMDLKTIREIAGKTQTDVAAVTEVSQAEVSRLERREDCLVSTLRRYVEALGGELKLIAVFGDRQVRLRALG